MPKKVMIDGKEVELFTKEEMEAKEKEIKEANVKVIEEASKKSAEAAIEKYKDENPDKTEEIDKLTKDLEEVNRKLVDAGDGSGDGDDDSPQIKRLRKERDEAEEKLTKGQEKMQKDLDTIKATLIGNVKQDILNKYSKDDQDLKEKIEFHFDSFKGDAVTKEEITTRMESAFQLATGDKPTKEVLDGLSSAGGKGDGDGDSKKKEPTENEKNIGKVLSISDADREKYGPGGEKAPKTTEKEE